MENSIILISIIIATCIFLYLRPRPSEPSAPLPPSPKAIPLLGNIMDLPSPSEPAYKYWLKYKDNCGPISSFRILGMTFIIVHDSQAATELLDKRSLKTSARPTLTFAGEMCGFGRLLTFRQPGETFRWHRKLIHQQLGTKTTASAFHGIQDVESWRFLVRVLEEPENLMKHIKTETAAIILKMTYGYTIEPRASEPLVELIEHMMENVNEAAIPMSWMVDIIPALQYLPDWFPGTGFKDIARQWRKVTDSALTTPYSFVSKQVRDGGDYRPSYVSALLEKSRPEGKREFKLTAEEEDAIKLTAGVMYAGGADTTVSTLSSFVLAMVLHPEVQRKAQREIDSVIGSERLPNFADQDTLPYVSALVKESIRWLPVIPMGIGHIATEEMTYDGYRIPKGSCILPAVWWFLHDPEAHPNPEEFDPERYWEPRNEPDPLLHAFGYGRRICPGRYLAADNMYITIARLLAVFDIGKAVDEQGKEMEAKLEASPGVLSYPAPFAYSIKPRSEKHAELIRAVERDHPWEKGDSSFLDMTHV